MTAILALDQGTTSSRALIVDREGKVLAVANEAMARANLPPADMAAIGITNQRETTILWNRKTGKPLFHAIVWQDRRTTPFCEELKKKGHEPLFQSKTGLLLDPYFSGTKVRWLLDHVPGARAQAEKGELAFGTIDSWLVWNLTRGQLHITDATNASRTLLYNIHTGEWDEELLKILEIPRSLLPEVKGCSEVYGSTAPHVFSGPIPIAGMAGDQQAALFGQGCFETGMAKSTYGTGCFILMNTGSKPVISKNHLLTTVALKIGGETQY